MSGGEGEANANAPGAPGLGEDATRDVALDDTTATLRQVTAMLANVVDKNQEMEQRIQTSTKTINETRAQTEASATQMEAIRQAMAQMSTAFTAVSETIEENARLTRQAVAQAAEAREVAEDARRQPRDACPSNQSDDSLPPNQQQYTSKAREPSMFSRFRHNSADWIDPPPIRAAREYVTLAAANRAQGPPTATSVPRRDITFGDDNDIPGDPSNHLTDHVRRTLARNAPVATTGRGAEDSEDDEPLPSRRDRRAVALPVEHISKFRGRPSDNAQAFLYDIKNYFTCEGVPSRVKVPTFLMYLDGKAKDFFHNEVQNKNLTKWSEVESLFRKRYIDTDNREESRARLRELRHNQRATAHDFLQQAELLAAKGYPDYTDSNRERVSLEHLRATHVRDKMLRGFTPSITSKMSDTKYDKYTNDELAVQINKLLMRERSLRLEDGPSTAFNETVTRSRRPGVGAPRRTIINEVLAEIKGAEDSLDAKDQLIQELKAENEILTRIDAKVQRPPRGDRPPPRDRTQDKCFVCGEVGHYKVECPVWLERKKKAAQRQDGRKHPSSTLPVAREGRKGLATARTKIAQLETSSPESDVSEVSDREEADQDF